MKSKSAQQGMGLVEVMISLVILLVAALATARMQSTGMISAQYSSFHLSLDHLSSEMLETLRAHSDDAEAGVFNFDMVPAEAGDNNTEGAGAGTTTGTGGGGVTIDARMQAWNTRITQVFPDGAGRVNCAGGFCDVVISWIEEIDGNYHRQFYNTRTSL
jgi:prepilin-type N-terminal cleavage/methylation domain-containing protein